MDKKQQYYKKDKKAQIYKKAGYIIDEYGDRVPGGYRPIAPTDLWCYTRQLTQQQKYIASSLSQDETRLFIFNYLKNVELYDLLLYKGLWYEVTRVDHKDDYNTETYVYVNDVGKNRGPDPDEILPYVDPNESTDGASDEVLRDEDGFPITR